MNTKPRLTWKFNTSMNYLGEFHDLYCDDDYENAWIQRMTPSGSQWAFVVAITHGQNEDVYPVRHSFAEAQADGIAWWTAQELERYK